MEILLRNLFEDGGNLTMGEPTLDWCRAQLQDTPFAELKGQGLVWAALSIWNKLHPDWIFGTYMERYSRGGIWNQKSNAFFG